MPPVGYFRYRRGVIGRQADIDLVISDDVWAAFLVADEEGAIILREANRLLRQYLPKGGDFRLLTQDQFSFIATELNTRPRQTLAWRTPATVLAEAAQAASEP